LFGKVTVDVQAAEGQGVITKIMLKSDSGNEIDWVHPPANDCKVITDSL
jgi:beta-glucanase (GH16 family)